MVLWAERPVRVDVAGVAYDLMGRRLPTGPVTASGDPLYVVSPAVAGVTASSLRATARPRARLSRAEHIVLAQRFPARNAAPGKDDGDAPPRTATVSAAVRAWSSTSTTSVPPRAT
ncbi:hypothetical protein [Streptomyces olindensis]|uniref:hypothetical protein n=1 Tax=Streptomyces olindensis TaxID=358823 RepID=UPI0036538E76